MLLAKEGRLLALSVRGILGGRNARVTSGGGRGRRPRGFGEVRTRCKRGQSHSGADKRRGASAQGGERELFLTEEAGMGRAGF